MVTVVPWKTIGDAKSVNFGVEWGLGALNGENDRTRRKVKTSTVESPQGYGTLEKP